MTAEVTLLSFIRDLPDAEGFDREFMVTQILQPLGIEADGAYAGLCEDILLSWADDAGGELFLKPGGWRIKVASSAARATFAAVLVGAGMMLIGADQIPLAVLPAALPLLIDMEKVRLDRAHRELIAPLRVASVGVEGVAVHPQVLYNRLDPAIRSELGYRDFLAFVERLIEAGELDDAGAGDVRARADGPAYIRITWS